MGPTFEKIMKIGSKKSFRRWWVKKYQQLFFEKTYFRVRAGTNGLKERKRTERTERKKKRGAQPWIKATVI